MKRDLSNEIDLTEALQHSFESDYQRPPNRISVSAVYGLLESWEDRPPDLLGMIRMTEGRAKHKMIQELLPQYQHEVKIEYPFGNLVLVGKADCVGEDHILEIKTSRELKDKAKEWEVCQAKLYCSLFEKPECWICQPCFTGEKLYLKILRRVKRNEDWFKETLQTLTNKIKL